MIFGIKKTGLIGVQTVDIRFHSPEPFPTFFGVFNEVQKLLLLTPRSLGLIFFWNDENLSIDFQS